MLNAGILQVTGRGTNVNFTIDDRAPFESVIAGVEECLVQNRHLFSKGNITVNVGRRILAREQLTQIKRILEAESGLKVAQFWCSPEILEETLSDFGPDDPPQWLAPEVPDRDTTIDSSDLEQVNPLIKSFAKGLEQTQTRPLPPKDSQDTESRFSPEAEAHDDARTLVEPAGQISPDSVGELIPDHSSEIIIETSEKTSEKTSEESTIEPILEPGLLELALVGLEQSIAEGGLESGQDVSSAVLQSSLEVPAPEASTGEAGLRPDSPANTGVEASISPHLEAGELNRQNEALLIKTTCRSGEVVRYAGDVVILADVNPGAQIIADGDILVFGSLRGLAHAGAGGDIQATIIALNLESPRIQIGPFIGLAPKAKNRNKPNRTGPTLAFVRRQHIFVAPFKSRFAGYSGGTIYDG